MSDSVRPHRWQPTRLPRPWDSPGKSTGVGCHFLLQCMKVNSKSEVAQSCPTLSDPMDCSRPGSSVHGIFQERVLEWGAIAFSNTGCFSSVQVSCSVVSNSLQPPKIKTSRPQRLTPIKIELQALVLSTHDRVVWPQVCHVISRSCKC